MPAEVTILSREAATALAKALRLDREEGVNYPRSPELPNSFAEKTQESAVAMRERAEADPEVQARIAELRERAASLMPRRPAPARLSRTFARDRDTPFKAKLREIKAEWAGLA